MSHEVAGQRKKRHAKIVRAKRRRYAKGWISEWVAAFWLFLKGYTVLDWRYRTAAGEIDLVVRRGKVVSFVEVKARKSFDIAAAAVLPKQKKRIFRAADIWVQRHSAYTLFDRSYDLISVVPWRGLQHHKQYFTW